MNAQTAIYKYVFPFRNTPITVGQLDREGANATPSANLDGSYLQGGGIVSKPHQPPPASRTTSSLPPNDAAEDDDLDTTTSKDAMADDSLEVAPIAATTATGKAVEDMTPTEEENLLSTRLLEKR